MDKIITIVGPTASGKTSLAIQLSKKLGSEVISLDSRQIYKGMGIGTAQPTIEEMRGSKAPFNWMYSSKGANICR